MRVDRGRLNWGVFFIVLGAVPLAYHQGAVSSSVLGEAWRLWPLVLVGIGLAFVLSRTPAFFIGGTIVAVCLGLVFGSVLAVGPNIGCGFDNNNPRTVSQSGNFGGASSVELNLDCGSATVTTSADGQWHVDATNTSGQATQVSSSGSHLSVSSAGTNGWQFNRGKDDWRIALPAGAQIDLTSTLDMGDAHFNLGPASVASARFTLNLGSLHVDLTGAQVGTLNVSTNLGSAFVILDGSSDLTADLKTNLGSLEVCVPANLGVRVTASDSLSSSDFGGAGLVRVGGTWQTPGYDNATHKANLTVETSLGSLKLRSAGGCK
ncbi:MAG: DUF4097 family beta strand repeat-containing protein [Candidatus Limnocylindrales bacterium]